jgi:hypothetical protein
MKKGNNMKITFEPALKKLWRISFMIALTGLLLTQGAQRALAACANPVGIAGEQIYNSSSSVMQFCDGTDWTAMKKGSDTLASLSCTDGQIAEWNNTGTSWVCATPASGADNLGNHTATTALDLATNKITNLGTPTAAADAATKAYVDAQVSGGGDNLGNHTATTALAMGVNNITGTGAISAGTLAASDTAGLIWESGINSITHNDGAGNVQIRFGNDFSSSDERFTHNGGAVYIGSNIDAASATSLTTKVASNPGTGNDTAITWGSALVQTATDITFGGTSLLTGTGDNLGTGGTTAGNVYATGQNIGRDAGDRITFANNSNMQFDVNGVEEMRLSSAQLDLNSNKIINIGGTDAALANGSGNVVIGLEAATNIVIDDNEIMARFNGAASQLLLQNDGGNVVLGSASPGNSNLDMNTGVIMNLSTPANDTDAATKKYVDDSIAAGGGSGIGGLTRCSNENSDGDGTNDKPECVAAATGGGLGTGDYRALTCQNSADADGGLMDWTGTYWRSLTNTWRTCTDGTLIVIQTPPSTGCSPQIPTWSNCVANSATPFLAEGATMALNDPKSGCGVQYVGSATATCTGGVIVTSGATCTLSGSTCGGGGGSDCDESTSDLLHLFENKDLMLQNIENNIAKGLIN